MKKKLLLSSGILALASPFISATCVVKNKTENDTPATAPAPNPVTPPAAEPVTPPNESPSVQPAPNPVNPPSNTEPTTPPNTQPSNPPANDKLEKELGKKHEDASAKLTSYLFSDANGRSIESIKSRIYRDSISGLDIDWNPSRDSEWGIARKIDNLIATEDHNESSSESTLRLFDDTYTDAKNKALLEKAKKDVADSNDRVERNSRSVENGNWNGISKDEEEKLRDHLEDVSESILNNDVSVWERKQEEARIAWENVFTEPFWNDISNRGWEKEYKDSLSRKLNSKNESLKTALKKLESKNNKEINLVSASHNSYLKILKSELEADKRSFEAQKADNESKLAVISEKLENSDTNKKASELKSLIADLNELLISSKADFNKLSDNVNYIEWLMNYGLKLRSDKETEGKELQKIKEVLEKYKQAKIEENKISEIDKKYDDNVKKLSELLTSEKTNKVKSEESLSSYKEELEFYDKFSMYLFPDSEKSYEVYLDKINELTEELESHKSQISDLENLKIEIEKERNSSISSVKAETRQLEDAVESHNNKFKALNDADNKVNEELSKANSQFVDDKKEIVEADKDIKNLENLISGHLYNENILLSELNKLGDEKKSLEAKSKEISEELAKLEEKEELIEHLEEIYNKQIEELEEKAYNSEKYLNDQIKKIELEISKLK
ncbi:Hypothetical protein, predicted lipoprotein, Spma family [Mycoplasmopsis agalactiae 14628]|uniref:Lipoprotein n=1 Tax=Mycoplasmopsis agalactiae 14628 TaxID=1110504 RepID=I5D631_MYCAA|nr:hypothetical protein [Mycoplasmopsis agalactiae]EIN15140.1 Hypothetical protein, predicted lipoprotein, Spma family [Mycoplasmopsis agalactiae 14628]